MKQYHITTKNIITPEPDDCVLDPGDPFHIVKKSIMLGGLGADEALKVLAIDNQKTFSANTKLERRTLPDPLTANEIANLKKK